MNIARSASAMDRIAPLWCEILATQPHTIFQSFAWNRLAAEIFQDQVTPRVVWVQSDSGAAIIPAALNRALGQIELLGDALFDYRDVLCAGDREMLRLAWQELASWGKPVRVLSVLKAAADNRWSDFPLTPFARAPRVERSRIDEAGFRLAHSRLGRQVRRLQKLGSLFRVYSGSESHLVRRLYAYKRSHFAAASDNLFGDQRRCEFMTAAAALPESHCEVYTLETEGGTLVASLVTFRDGDVRRCYTIYFHPEWARYSPGVALLYEVTARSLGEGLSCDYMTGEYPYKLRLANGSRALYRVEASAQELADIAGRAASSAA